MKFTRRFAMAAAAVVMLGFTASAQAEPIKFGVAADWYTGKHTSGYFTPGINFKAHPKVTGYVGYSIGNTAVSNGNHFFYTAIGINFN